MSVGALGARVFGASVCEALSMAFTANEIAKNWVTLDMPAGGAIQIEYRGYSTTVSLSLIADWRYELLQDKKSVDEVNAFLTQRLGDYFKAFRTLVNEQLLLEDEMAATQWLIKADNL